MKYSKLSLELTKKISKKDKKRDGIFFTPPDTVSKIVSFIKSSGFFTNTNGSILEPSCGSGEFLTVLREKFPESTITGIEKNSEIFGALGTTEGIKLLNEDFLESDIGKDTGYDLIIGNPPYAVLKKKDVDKRWYGMFEGRPNIFVLFIAKSLELLRKDTGILSFVLPKSFCNCLYYDRIRKRILEDYTVLDMFHCDDKYIETSQETVVLTVLNRPPEESKNDRFCMKIGRFNILGDENGIARIKELYRGSRSLNSMGFSVNVGKVVWNKCKDILTDEATHTRLIYSSDIVDRKPILKKYKNKAKKSFIRKSGVDRTVLLINRGYGKGEYKFNLCLIKKGDFAETGFLIENHLVAVNYNADDLSETELIDYYEKIVESLEDSRTQEFISLYFGNNAINTTELTYILPIYL